MPPVDPREIQRNISYTPATRSDLAPEPPSEEEASVEDGDDPLQDIYEELSRKGDSLGKGETRQPETYREFMEAAGGRFKLADRPNKWLGGGPFPMNPSFKPPPPVSDSIRDAIYATYMADPIKNNVRELSQKFHLSLKRIDAILRLKGMEADWVKGIPLQTGFRKGMEMILDVPRQIPESQARRKDVHEADILEQDENRDAARQRYQQLYWESVPEDGREPVVPASLEHAKVAAKRYTEKQEAFKSNRNLMPIVNDPRTQSPDKIQFVTKPGRPTLKFVDVGGHFIDVNQRLHRIADAQRRLRHQRKMKQEKKGIAKYLEQRSASRVKEVETS
ncbi:hypothetical protein H0H93_005782 [Arthromyces matolae]|nr:hypothetical protein H0H93_005782 [Arthromyces matolae]